MAITDQTVQLIKGSFEFSDFLLKNYPVSTHKILTLGQQNVLLNICLEQRLKGGEGSDYVIARPVAMLNEAVLACKNENGEWDQQKLNGIFDKIIPEKSALGGKKLVIARTLCLGMTLSSIATPLRQYLKEKNIDYCFVFSVSEKAYRVYRENFDPIKGSDLAYLILSTEKQDPEAGDFLDLSFFDVVEPQEKDYLLQPTSDVWSYPENPLHIELINYVKGFDVEE